MQYEEKIAVALQWKYLSRMNKLGKAHTFRDNVAKEVIILRDVQHAPKLKLIIAINNLG